MPGMGHTIHIGGNLAKERNGASAFIDVRMGPALRRRKEFDVECVGVGKGAMGRMKATGAKMN